MAIILEAEYEDIFSPETMAALKGKSGESLRQMLGNKQLMQTLVRSKEVLDDIVDAEKGYHDLLEGIAIEMVTQAYPIIDYANIKIEAKIGPDMPMSMPKPDEEEEEDELEFDNPEVPEAEEFEKAKRRIINGITQGASIRGAFAFYLFREYLDDMDDTLVEKYNEILKLVFGIYDDENAIAMMLAALAQGQKMQGGESEIEYDKENKQFIIKAHS